VEIAAQAAAALAAAMTGGASSSGRDKGIGGGGKEGPHAAGRLGSCAPYLRLLPGSACRTRTPGSRLSQALSTWSLFFDFSHLVLCSRTMGFPNVHSAVKQTHN
jgi:hypothetical protein